MSGTAQGAAPKQAAASPGGRPRALLVGALGGARSRLDGALELENAAPEEAPRRLEAAAADVVLLDGSLAPARLSPLLEVLGSSPDRPAVLVVTPGGRRLRLTGAETVADDFVSGARGERELLARVRSALRLRGYAAELTRKNAELEGLHSRVEAMGRRMAEDLRLASSVQRSLLPTTFHHPRLDVAREYVPFREIGGDYYDFVPLDRDRMAFAIGDVMGKGVPAALLAANLRASLRAQLQAGYAAPGEVVGRVNQLFWEVIPSGLFATLFFAVFDLGSDVLEYVNAGHHYPFLVRPGGETQDLVEGGTVLGLMEDSAYASSRVRLGRDDLLVFYTDGVTDRSDAGGEIYGPERLKEAAVRVRGDDARLALYTLLGEVQGWSAGSPAEDDLTLIVAKLR